MPGRYNFDMPENEPLPVEFDELLAAEFNYIAQTAIQANEDRARVSSFYLVAVGSLLAALFGTQYVESNVFAAGANLVFSGLFVLLTLLGTSTVIQLARLRSAWYESATAMNQIKEYATKQNESLISAFRWTNTTLPSKYKKNSISYYQATEVALISGLMLGAAAFFLLRVAFEIGPLQWIVIIMGGLATVAAQLQVYKQALH